MGIIKYFRKKYWEAAIFRGGRRIPFSCDGLTAVPDRAYALFTEKELEKIYNDRNEFYKKLMQMIATVYKGNIIKNLIMDCQSYTKYRPNETTGGIFVSWRRKEALPTGA